MEGVVSYRLRGHAPVTIDQIWYCCHKAADANALKDLSLSCALLWRLVGECYFETLHPETRLKAHNLVFEELLPTEWDFKRAFKIIEVELGFCYDFFFTKYHHSFFVSMLPVPFIQSFILFKIILILIVGVLAIRKSVVLETPDPIIEVHNSKADYIITLLVLGIAFLVELAQAAFYLASNWAQVALASMYVKKYWYQPNAFIFGKVIGFLRRVMISGQLRNKINQHSVIFQRNQMSGKYSWALNDFSQLEVLLIWHIATEYCDAISDDPSNGNGTTPSSNHRGAHLFGLGHVLQLLRRDPRRNKTARQGDRGVAVHLSRYCTYLIVSVPELLSYHEADIAELSQELMEDCKELFKSCDGIPEIYSKIKSLNGTPEEEDDPRKMFQQGVKLGKQLEQMGEGYRRWEVLKDFWAKKIIHVAASHYTSKQHMQHLENGGEFLTHIWALLSHAGILNLKRGKDQEGQANNPGSGTSAATG